MSDNIMPKREYSEAEMQGLVAEAKGYIDNIAVKMTEAMESEARTELLVRTMAAFDDVDDVSND